MVRKVINGQNYMEDFQFKKANLTITITMNLLPSNKIII